MLNAYSKLSQVKNNIWDAVVRFPLANACAIICFTISWVLIDKEKEPDGLILNGLICSVLGISFFISAQLLNESQAIRMRQSWLIKIVAVGIAVGFFFSLPEKMYLANICKTVILLCISHLSVTFIPFLNRKQVQYFWQFNQTLFLRILESILYSGVLFVGILLALVATDQLFEIKMDPKIYGKLFFFMSFVINTIFFTAGIPKSFDAPVFYPKGLKVFCQFVLIPLVSLYQVILYAYFAKVLITNSWPSGWVSYLVLFCTGFGILIVLLIWPLIYLKEYSWMKGYVKATFVSIIPLSFLMAWAVYKRIDEYSFTEGRLILVLLTVWLLFISIYFIVSKLKSIKVIPVSLSIFLLIGNTGPWSFYSLSQNTQFSSLKDILRKNGLVKNEIWIKAKKELPKSVEYEIGDKSKYLIEHFGNESLVPIVPTLFLDSLEKKGKWMITENLLDTMGLQFVSFDELNDKSGKINAFKYLEIKFLEDYTPTGFLINGYQYFIPFEFNTDSQKVYVQEIELENAKTGIQKVALSFNLKEKTLSLLNKKVSLSLTDLCESLFNQYKNTKSSTLESQTKSPIFEFYLNTEKYRFLILKLGIESENNHLKIKQLKGILIVKKQEKTI